jgi:acetate kinase
LCGASGAVLTLNAGSSSLKFALFEAGDTPSAKARGEIEDLDSSPHLLARDAAGATLLEKHWPDRLPDPFATVLAALLAFTDKHLGPDGLAAVGHRIVHGGPDHTAPALVTPKLLSGLEALIPLDPLHMPHNLAPLHAVAAARADLPQVACFDTAFHHTLPPVARAVAIPRELTEAGIRHYGFHGLSYEYIAGELKQRAPDLARGRVIVAHLGAGASLCALLDGRSIATTMGFSALDGLVMATRCGNLDPGVILYLGRQGHSFGDIEDMLYHRSGLLGVSKLSGDIRVLLESKEPAALEAIELFNYRVATQVGSLVVALGGLDGLVFTAGIGQHAPVIRAHVCNHLTWLGVRIDEVANKANSPRIGTPDSAVEVRVMATDEEAVIARHTRSVLEGSAPRSV